jgi:hypothetical protein
MGITVYVYTIEISPANPQPLDEGTTFWVSVLAVRKRDAIRKLLRYMPGTIISVRREKNSGGSDN